MVYLYNSPTTLFVHTKQVAHGQIENVFDLFTAHTALLLLSYNLSVMPTLKNYVLSGKICS